MLQILSLFYTHNFAPELAVGIATTKDRSVIYTRKMRPSCLPVMGGKTVDVFLIIHLQRQILALRLNH